MINITDAKREEQILPLWRLAFRPFFLFGGLFSSFAILLWGLYLADIVSFEPYTNMLFWHAHEMLFGFVSVFIVGFLLTAVQNWTGIRATHGKPLMLLVGLWLTARMAFLLGDVLPAWLIILLDVSFIPLAAGYFFNILRKAGHKRNLFFVPVLLLLAVGNLLLHLSVVLQLPVLKEWGLNATLMIIALIMTIVAGRVMPMFTANGTATCKVEPLRWLEYSVIGTSVTLVALYLSGLVYLLPGEVIAAVFTLAAICQILRCARWKPWITLKHPLLWSLHFAYWFIPLAFALFASYKLGWIVNASIAIHALTAGAMSSMILSMICRVSLGHTGRMLSPPGRVKWLLLLVIWAGLVRVFGVLTGFDLIIVYLLASLLWSLAYLLFVVTYGSMLVKPRVDGRPG
ncbi:NnrS family protein [Neptunicella sp. SCSIO 80796]|uniref:NnrS family protein n=1 Tax=Neptunicella plasticusilytica TaxID=3117012 RepID=UPI003A4D35B0